MSSSSSRATGIRSRRPTSQVAIVLGGDGTMIRALHGFLGTGFPVIGVNFGRVGFLSAIPRDELESGVARVFGGELEIVELATLEVEAEGKRHVAVNDAVVASGELGRMVELEWSIGSEDFGRVPCDGLICSTPSGSTAYNLSNGGPVLMWGLDAMALTFVAPHDLRARPFVVPRGHDLARLEPHRERRLRRARRRPPGRRRRAGSAGLDRARRAALAARARFPTRRSCGATGRASGPRSARPSAGLSSSGHVCGAAPPVYHHTMLRRLRIENLVLIREADLELGPGLNVLSGETGAGKTIFAQAIGLLLGVKGDAGAVGPAASEAYVEAELDVPDGFFDDGGLESLAELRPEDEAGPRARPARLRGRTHAGLRLGSGDRARGSRRGHRAADRDVGPVRAAPARPARLSARRARRVRRRRAGAAAA